MYTIYTFKVVKDYVDHIFFWGQANSKTSAIFFTGAFIKFRATCVISILQYVCTKQSWTKS